jgi:hypothetical protein
MMNDIQSPLRLLLGISSLFLISNQAMAMNHPVSLMFEEYTSSDSLTGSDALHFNSEIGISQDVTEHMYYALSATKPQDDAYNVELDLGLQGKYAAFLPFIELETVNSHSRDGNQLSFDYDFGTAYALTEKVYPLLGFDGVGTSAPASMKLGAQYKFKPRLALTLTATKNIDQHGSGAQAKLSYTFV